MSASESQRRSPSATVPRLSLRPEQAAAALGVSRSFFFASILPELRIVRCGRVRLVPVPELERWLEENAARTLEHPSARC